jgi:hypothetical protein
MTGMTPIEAARLILADYAGELQSERCLDLAGCQSRIVNDVLVVRGTDQWADWARYNFLSVPWPGDRYWWHKGFLNHAQRTFAFAKGKGIKLVIGHSLGAAAAGIVSVSLGVPGIGFATPRQLFSRACPPNQMVNYCRRDDLVSYVPFGCRHVGETHWLPAIGGRRFREDHRIQHYIECLEAAVDREEAQAA